MEPLTRIELVTPSLPWRCSTTELQRLAVAAILTVTLVTANRFLPAQERLRAELVQGVLERVEAEEGAFDAARADGHTEEGVDIVGCEGIRFL